MHRALITVYIPEDVEDPKEFIDQLLDHWTKSDLDLGLVHTIIEYVDEEDDDPLRCDTCGDCSACCLSGGACEQCGRGEEEDENTV